MNGSQSSDDLGIVRWRWERDGTSLAIGTIVGHSDQEPVLVVNSIEMTRLFRKVIKIIEFSSSQTLSLVDMFSN